MRKWIVGILALLLIAVPALAQDAEPLPAGCNVSTLGTIFTSTGESLSEEQLTAAEAVFIIDMLDTSLAALRDACAPDEAEADENRLDYSGIPQSRTADGAFVLGEPDAPITIVEFADFLCPHCQTYHTTMRQLIETYVVTGQAKFEYRFYPVVDANLSPLTARMTECADILNPGGFWRAHDVMYELAAARFNSLTPFTFAARVGLDYEALAACVREDANQVQTDVELGQTAGISGTPSVMVRYGDGDLEDIDPDSERPVRSSIPFAVLAAVIEDAQ
jgi:protein-disulfide isomerase